MLTNKVKVRLSFFLFMMTNRLMLLFIQSVSVLDLVSPPFGLGLDFVSSPQSLGLVLFLVRKLFESSVSEHCPKISKLPLESVISEYSLTLLWPLTTIPLLTLSWSYNKSY